MKEKIERYRKEVRIRRLDCFFGAERARLLGELKEKEGGDLAPEAPQSG